MDASTVGDGRDEWPDPLPLQDPNFDHMYEAFNDAGCASGPGVAGDYGASLDVSPSRMTH